MTRVVFVQGAGERGGAERVLLSLLAHLPHPVEPTVVALADGPFIDEVEGAGIPVHRLPPPGRARALWRARETAGAIADVARETGADVIHSNGEKMALYGGAASRLAGRPSVVWLHDAPLRGAPAAALQLVTRSRRHTYVAGSEWMAAAFRRRLRVPVLTIPHGVDLRGLPATTADVLDSTGWPTDSLIFGHFARLQRWKGADVFLRAAAEVAASEPRARFLVVGGALYGWETEYAASLPRLAADLGIAERVTFLGHRDDALALMAGCDAVVHASVRPEPLGLVVLEAQALGRAVVATRTGGPEELVADGRTGRLVTPNDSNELAAVMSELAANRDRRHALGRAAAVHVRAERSAATMGMRFAALYEELTTASRRTARA